MKIQRKQIQRLIRSFTLDKIQRKEFRVFLRIFSEIKLKHHPENLSTGWEPIRGRVCAPVNISIWDSLPACSCHHHHQSAIAAK
jgi:hypothetical protein